MTAKSGIFAAPMTPMRADLSVDLPRYVAHCRRLLDAGCHGLMPLGSTGEAHSLTVDERIAMMDALADAGLPMDTMLIGTSSLAWPDAVRMAQHATGLGAGGVCVQPPFYYKPPDDDALVDFFARVVDDVNDPRLRLYVYDWQPNLGVHLSLDLFERLFAARSDNIVGIKDSSGDAEMLRQRCAAFPDREVLAGTDSMILTGLRAGGSGAMSGISNIMPETTLALFADPKGENGDARQARIDAALKIMRAAGWFASLKAALVWLTGDDAWRHARPGIGRLDAEQERALIDGLSGLGLGPAKAAAE
ncbi:MAG: dihydrodipicolinate synthase family protein [Alphaproteobacteria bacterium]